jgi:general L-amino acid transport system substrate-binding protein
MLRPAILALGVLAGSMSLALPAAAQATLEAVKKRGEVLCGVSGRSQGFSFVSPSNEWSGLDVDLCRAIAAAVLADAKKVRFVMPSPTDRLQKLQAEDVDLLVSNITFTLQREAGVGLQVGLVNYYDGQAFVVARKSGITTLTGLSGSPICMAAGTTHLGNTADWFQARGLKFTPVVLDNKDLMYEAFFAGRCAAATEDSSALAAAIVGRANAADFAQLPEIISKEPLGPYVRAGDEKWLSIVRWTQYATLEAEELAVFQANVDERIKSPNPAIQRLLGVLPGNGKALGLDEKWAYNIIKQVGNYAESYERNVGMGSPLKFQRGINALWTKGGLMYPVPLR